MQFIQFQNPINDQPAIGVQSYGKVVNLTSITANARPAWLDAPISCLTDVMAATTEELTQIWHLAQNWTSAEDIFAYEDVKILPPLQPKKNVFCVGRNYREHIIEGNIANGRPPNSFPQEIEIFTKPITAVVGHDDVVNLHADLTSSLDYEAELAIVIGKKGANIPESEAMDYVFGYTLLNDVTARDLQKAHGQWFKGKGLDTTCPIGPAVTHKDSIPDPQNLTIELLLNGELRQSASTSEMIFSITSIVSRLSAGMTLEPGDIIATGTPKGVGFAAIPPRCLKEGDVTIVRIQEIGELRNTFRQS